MRLPGATDEQDKKCRNIASWSLLFNDIHAAEFPPEKTFYTMPVKSFEPNGIGLYNVCGNVAEMTVSAGYAMGGSWNSYGGEIYPTSIKQYTYPSAEVGFRVFMKIVEQ